MSERPISCGDVRGVGDRLRPHLPPTPLRSYPVLDREGGGGIRVLVKHESVQLTG